MRFFEILLSLANFLAFCVIVIPLTSAMGFARYTTPAALLIAVIQIADEGPRWQMIPAYMLTAIFSLLWLTDILFPGGIQVHPVVSILGTGAGMLTLLVAIALPVLLPVFRFPKPAGPYAIGTLTYHWVDTSRPELFTIGPGDHRELMVQVWYPAKNEPLAQHAPYIPDAEAVTPAMAYVTHYPRFLFSHLKYVKTNAIPSAPVADDQPSYPVLIYLTGLGGFRSVSTFQIEALVSHGYIVVGLDQPGAVAMVRLPDGREISGWPRENIQPLITQSVEPQSGTPSLHGEALPDGVIPYFAQDASFTLDQLAKLGQDDPNHLLTGRLDLEHAGVFGISLGGMNAAEICLKDPRLKACLIMDVHISADVVKAGLKRPTMFITRDAGTMRLERERAGGWTEKDIALTLDTMKSVYQNLPGDGYYVEIPKMFHLNFTDAPYWSPVTSLIGLTGPINGQRGFDIVNAYTLAFFDKELKGQTSLLLDETSDKYPEVNFGRRSS